VVEHGYSSITIEALTARADTSKATFYAHFHDMEDLLGFVGDLVADLVTEAESAVTTGKQQPIAHGDALVTMCRHVDANRDLYRVALSGAGNGQGRATLTAALTAATEQVFVRVVNEMGASPRRQVTLLARSWAGAASRLSTTGSKWIMTSPLTSSPPSSPPFSWRELRGEWGWMTVWPSSQLRTPTAPTRSSGRARARTTTSLARIECRSAKDGRVGRRSWHFAAAVFLILD
jgi:AcrR family transcriptional regulator